MNRQKCSPVFYKLDSKGKMRVWSLEVFETPDLEVYEKIVSGLLSGKQSARTKKIKDSKHDLAWDRAIKLQRNAIERKRREGYTTIQEEALNAPTFSAPMKAQTYDPDKTELPEHFYIQPKINGLRCIYFPETDELRTKSGLTWDIPEIMNDVRTLSEYCGGAPVDGELYIHDTPVATIKSVCHKPEHELRSALHFRVFDIVTEDPQHKRFGILEQAFNKLWDEVGMAAVVTGGVRLVPFEHVVLFNHGEQKLKEQFDHYLYLGFEGLMIRSFDAPYESDKRSKHLLKWKPVYDAEYEVVHITYENRMVNGIQYKLVEFHCYDPHCEQMFKAVPKWDVERRFQFYKDNQGVELQTLLHKLPPLQVEFRERTKNGIPFHAVAIDFREEGY